MQSNGIILAVDDEAINLLLLEKALEDHGYEVVRAENGMQAWEILEREPERFDAVLLDRMMPLMDGMDVLARVRAHPRMRFLPVILQTAAATSQSIAEGVRAGAYYYLTKPFSEEMLVAVVHAAVEDMRSYRDLQGKLDGAVCSMTSLMQGEFAINTLGDARELAQMLSAISPRPHVSVIGLSELLVNAHEHGNLGIGYEEKGRLMEAGCWQAEILRREKLPENQAKQVRIAFERLPDGVRVTIRDQGEGFDWAGFMNISLERAFDTHGRGIAISRTMSFNRMVYEGNGNTVVAEIHAKDGEMFPGKG